MKKFILIGIVFLVAILAYYIYLSVSVPKYEPTYTVLELKSDILNDSVYLKKKVWGIAANHQVIVVSSSGQSEFEPDLEKQYIYEGFTPILYEFLGDTLKMYVRKASEIPSSFESAIKIEQVVLDTPEMIELLAKHEERGIELLSR